MKESSENADCDKFMNKQNGLYNQSRDAVYGTDLIKSVQIISQMSKCSK